MCYHFRQGPRRRNLWSVTPVRESRRFPRRLFQRRFGNVRHWSQPVQVEWLVRVRIDRQGLGQNPRQLTCQGLQHVRRLIRIRGPFRHPLEHDRQAARYALVRRHHRLEPVPRAARFVRAARRRLLEHDRRAARFNPALHRRRPGHGRRDLVKPGESVGVEISFHLPATGNSQSRDYFPIKGSGYLRFLVPSIRFNLT